MNILLNSLTLPLRVADSTPAAATEGRRPPTPHIGLKRPATAFEHPGHPQTRRPGDRPRDPPGLLRPRPAGRDAHFSSRMEPVKVDRPNDLGTGVVSCPLTPPPPERIPPPKT